jgi:hypothetical protein
MNDRARDPRRFLDSNETEPVLRDALAAARARAPSDAALAQLAARLPLPGSGGPGGPSGGTPAAAPAASGATLSSALIGAGLVLVVGATFVWQAAHETPSQPEERAAVTATVTSSAPAPTVSPIVPSASATVAPAARPVESPALASAAPATSAAHGASSSPPEASAAPAMASADAETEAHFLDRARAALGSSPAQALSLTAEHAHRFPSGALGQEREVVAIQALSRLGRADEARSRAQRFLAAFPGSVHRRRIEALVSP